MKVPKGWESAAHIAMGFGAELTNLRLLLNRRERRQLPPENDRYPVQFIDLARPDENPKTERVEYWARVRVLDTLDDSWEYRVGETFGWFVLVAGAFALGAWLL